MEKKIQNFNFKNSEDSIFSLIRRSHLFFYINIHLSNPAKNKLSDERRKIKIKCSISNLPNKSNFILQNPPGLHQRY